ncbi:AIPR family protein [Patescibacteria group bacterium]|nr:AIPR family protein [Patescibacteria group bacterium]
MSKKIKNSVPEIEVIDLETIDNIIKLQLDEKVESSKGKAFESICHNWICNKNLGEFKKDDTDGNGEFGIDSINIDKNDNGGIFINIISCTYSGGFSYKKTDEIKKGLKIVFEDDEYKKLKNEKLKKKISFIRKNKSKIQNVKVFYCVNGVSKPDEDCLKSQEQLLEKLKTIFSARYDKKLEFDFLFFGAKEIFEKKMRNENPLSKNSIKIKYKEQINKFNKNKEEELSRGKIEGCIITMEASELKNILKKCGDWIFHYNIRKFKGKNSINKKIIKTIESEDKKKFWFLNNGVTMVCENAIESKKNILILKYPQIVNGQQTVKTIDSFPIKKLKDIDVLIRLYVTDNDEFFSDIAEATNSQTRIDYSDISSNKSEQHAIKYFFENFGYYYKNKKGIEKKKFKTGIDSKGLGRISLSTFNKKPSSGRKTTKDSIIFDESNYPKLFNVSPHWLLVSFLIYDFCRKNDSGIKNIKRMTTDKEIKHWGYFHLSALMWSYLEKNGTINNESQILELIKNKNFDEFYKKAFLKIKEVIVKEKRKDHSIVLKDYFNNEKLDDLIFSI